jgi:hypothetical protein
MELFKISTSLTSQYYDNTENKTVVIKDMELEVDDINSLWELLADPYNEGAQEVCINDDAESDLEGTVEEVFLILDCNGKIIFRDDDEINRLKGLGLWEDVKKSSSPSSSSD